MKRDKDNNIILTPIEATVMFNLAVRGYNAETKYKTCKPHKNERPSEKAMRRGEESETIEELRGLLDTDA